jgi:hypothetical protein
MDRLAAGPWQTITSAVCRAVVALIEEKPETLVAQHDRHQVNIAS